MKYGKKQIKTCIETDFLEVGESIEDKMRRVTTTNEPIDNVAPLNYTERKEGVRPEYDIRTDRFDIAMEAMGAVEKSITAKRQQKIEQAEKEKAETETNN